ncbi:MAG: hypothetical protein R3B07_35065 [Polyangiaceae bacterium]
MALVAAIGCGAPPREVAHVRAPARLPTSEAPDTAALERAARAEAEATQLDTQAKTLVELADALDAEVEALSDQLLPVLDGDQEPPRGLQPFQGLVFWITPRHATIQRCDQASDRYLRLLERDIHAFSLERAELIAGVGSVQGDRMRIARIEARQPGGDCPIESKFGQSKLRQERRRAEEQAAQYRGEARELQREAARLRAEAKQLRARGRRP